MKKKKIYIIFIIIICIITAIAVVVSQKANNEDAKKFAEEYVQVSQKNVFVYEEADKIIDVLEKGTGIIYLGYPECPWCQSYAEYLNETANEIKIKKIMYCNIRELKKNNREKYDKIISLIKGYLPYEIDESNPVLYVPNITIVKNGKIIGNENTTAKDTGDILEPEEFWDNERVLELKETLKTYMKEIK